jgi:hypothetical protein
MPALLLAIGLAGLALAANLELTRRSPLLTTDSASYLSAAENLASGEGLTTSFNDSLSVYHPREVVAFNGRVPFVHFEPLYSLLLAALHVTGLSEIGAARVIGAVSLAVCVLLLCALASRACQGSLPLVFVFVVVTVIGPSGKGFVAGNLLELSGEVLSEPVFYAFSLAALLACALFLDKGSTRYLVMTMALVAGATLTRYVGASVALATSIAILSTTALPRRRRLRSAIGVIGVGVVAVVGWPIVERWLSGGSSPRQIAFHLHPHLVADFLATAASWFFPTGWPSWLTDSGALLLLAIAAIAPLSSTWFGLIKPADGAPPQTQSLLRLLAIFLLSYVVVILVSSTFLDASLSLDQRVLGPLQVASSLILLSLTYWTIRSRWAVDFRFGPVVITVVVALLVIAPNVALAVRQLGHPFPAPVATPAMTALAKLPGRDVVVTNEPSGVFIYTHRGSVLTPVRTYAITTKRNAAFEKDVDYIGQLVRRRHGVVALVPDLLPTSLTVGQLQRWAGLVVTRRFADGTVFLSAPG